MKKTLTLMAVACAIGLCAPAWGTQVLSSNVVGYQKLTIYPTWTMIANPFVTVGTNNEQPLNAMFDSAETTIAGGDTAEVSDNLQIWTGSNYDTYYFGNFAGEYGDEYDNVWYLFGEEDPTEETFPIGHGAWFKNYSGTQKTISVSGQVGTDAVTVSIGSTWTMLANPFPIDIPLNGDLVNWKSAGVSAGDTAEVSDNIQLWTGTTYNTYYFGNFNGEYGEEYDDVWYKFGEEEPTTDSIPFGTAVWYKNYSGKPFSITFESPMK